MKCSQCDLQADYVDKKRRLCNMHYRFNQMRQDSKFRYGTKTTVKELEGKLPKDLVCPKCQVQMVWRRGKNEKRVNNLITIQHWKNGEVSFLCLSCNVRHASMVEEMFIAMPDDHKLCPHCKTIKHSSEFGVKNSRANLKRNSICKPCNIEKSKEYKELNKEKINAFQRAYRLKRKLSGNPIKRKKNEQQLVSQG